MAIDEDIKNMLDPSVHGLYDKLIEDANKADPQGNVAYNIRNIILHNNKTLETICP